MYPIVQPLLCRLGRTTVIIFYATQLSFSFPLNHHPFFISQATYITPNPYPFYSRFELRRLVNLESINNLEANNETRFRILESKSLRADWEVEDGVWKLDWKRTMRVYLLNWSGFKEEFAQQDGVVKCLIKCKFTFSSQLFFCLRLFF